MSRQERHIEQFYEWEVRGRGWFLFDGPVDLEPPFHPFFFHRVPLPYTDDGKRPTILSSIADMFRAPQTVSEQVVPELPHLEAFTAADAPLRVMGISFQRGANVKPERMEHLFALLVQLTGQLSFEIIATHERIAIQLVCNADDYTLIRAQLRAYMPEAIVQDGTDHLCVMDNALYTVDYGLQDEFMRPLAFNNDDWYVTLFAYLDLLQPGEQAVIQFLFAGTCNAWAESIMRSVTINGKESFFEDAPEMPSLAQEKVSRPLVAATIRAFTQAENMERAGDILRHISTTLIAASTSKCNALLPLNTPDYDIETRIDDMLHRRSHRLGMLLNVRELASLAHFPSAAVRSTKLLLKIKTTKPTQHTAGTYQIGINVHQGIEQPVYVPDVNRLEHIHIIGATGTGKSTLLHSLMCQDIAAGNGFALLDPHGDLVEQVLAYIPPERINDVVLIDPSDADYPIGFNLLHAHSDLEKELLASDLVALFRRFSTSWGDQMNSVFANAILAFLESTKGGTLIDLRRFLIEKTFREQFLATVQDPSIVYYWQHEYPLLKSGSIGSILTRLDAFLRPKLIRNMVSQQRSPDFGALMDTGKIILVKLSHGLIGEENSYLLGASIVAKIQQAAMARQIQSQADRKPYYLYIDEFHHFLTASIFSAILTGARKYKLGLTVAHQDMQQVSKHDAELASAIIANAGTRICFRLGEADAKKFADGFSSFSAEDIQTLERGDAIMRIGGADHDCNVRVIPTSATQAHNIQEQIIAASRDTYATRREEPLPVAPSPPHTKEKPATPPITNQPPIIIVPSDQQEEAAQRLATRIEQKQHRHWQNVIQKIAEEKGYRSSIERPTPDGKGQVDVSLERDNMRIAVEISVSTKAEWELHNIRKCLDAGYDKVIACSPNKQTVQQVRQRVFEEYSAIEQQRIIVTEAENVSQYLAPLPEEPEQTEQVIKGYRVKVSYTDVGQQERLQKHLSVSKIVRDGIQKKQ